MKPETNQPKNRHIDEIIEELQEIVGLKKVVFMSEVPPGASLQALKQAYKEAGLILVEIYPSKASKVKVALNEIYRQLNSQVYG